MATFHRKQTETREQQQRALRPTLPPLTCYLALKKGWGVWAVRVQDLSANGIRVQLPRSIPAGLDLTAKLYNVTHRFARRCRLRAYSIEETGSAGLFLEATFERQLCDEDIWVLKGIVSSAGA
jgi:hypothetical protein